MEMGCRYSEPGCSEGKILYGRVRITRNFVTEEQFYGPSD